MYMYILVFALENVHVCICGISHSFYSVPVHLRNSHSITGTGVVVISSLGPPVSMLVSFSCIIQAMPTK